MPYTRCRCLQAYDIPAMAVDVKLTKTNLVRMRASTLPFWILCPVAQFHSGAETEHDTVCSHPGRSYVDRGCCKAPW